MMLHASIRTLNLKSSIACSFLVISKQNGKWRKILILSSFTNMLQLCSVLLKCQNAVQNVGIIQKYQLVHYPRTYLLLLSILEISCCVGIAFTKSFRDNNCKEISAVALLGLGRSEHSSCLCSQLYWNLKSHFKVRLLVSQPLLNSLDNAQRIGSIAIFRVLRNISI